MLLVVLLLEVNLFAAGVDFFVNDKVKLVRMSPDGERLAFAYSAGDSESINVRMTGQGDPTALFDINELVSENGVVADLGWVDNETIYVSVYALTDGVAQLSDTRNEHYEVILFVPSGEVRVLQTSGTLLSTLPETPHKISYAVTGSTSYVYHIDTRKLSELDAPLNKASVVDGGQFSRANRVSEVPGFVFSWLVDPSGEVRSVTYWDFETGMHLATRPDPNSDWTTLKTWRAEGKRRSRRAQLEADLEETTYRLLAVDEDPAHFLALAEADNGRQAVYRYNVATQARELIYQHPTAEIVGVDVDRKTAGLLSVRYFEAGYIKQHFFHVAPQNIVNEVQNLYPNHNVLLVDTAPNEKYGLALYASDDPGWVLIYDGASKSISLSQSLIPSLEGKAFATAKAYELVRDQITIEYFLTLPAGEKPFPLVVYPHGGPFGVTDSLAYNPAVQYLASLGLAVLQVNFRGSGGYGEEFLDAGQGQFGELMLDDIEAALAHVAKRPEIASERSCVVGDSYGGYAALMLAVRSPTRFRCIASFAGVSDLGLLMSQFADSRRPELVDLFLGIAEDKSNEATYAALKALSPLYRARELETPLFLSHGKQDRRVDIEQSYRLEYVLRKLEKPITTQYYPEEGHGFSEPVVYFAHMQRVGEFLLNHLASPDAIQLEKE